MFRSLNQSSIPKAHTITVLTGKLYGDCNFWEAACNHLFHGAFTCPVLLLHISSPFIMRQWILGEDSLKRFTLHKKHFQQLG